MGWYLRKSFSAGPIRLNLSKSGLGASVGVRGARVGIGPKGTYTHAGRGGLYYRKYHSSVAVKTRQAQSERLTDNEYSSGARYEDEQIARKDMSLELSLQRKPTGSESALFYFGGIVVFIGLMFLLGGSESGFWTSVIIGFGVMFPKLKNYYKFNVSKTQSNKIYKWLVDHLLKFSSAITTTSIQEAKTYLDSLQIDEMVRNYALARLYRDYLTAILSDVQLTEEEVVGLQLLEGLLNLDPTKLHAVRRWGFNRAYLQVVEDQMLTREEESQILRIKNVLKLTDEEIKDEMDTLNLLREIRSINEGDLKAVEVETSLTKGEICYHVTEGRIVKEKTLRSFQSGGERHHIKDWVTEKQGQLLLTSKRICVVGSGVTSIKLEKVMNLETDIDTNTVSLDIDNRKTPLVLSTPDSYIFSAKLNKVLGGALV